MIKTFGVTTTSLLFNLSLKNVARASSEVTEEEKLRAIDQIRGLSTFSLLQSKLQAYGLSPDMQDCYFQKQADDPNIWGLGFLAKESVLHPRNMGFISVTGSFLENRVIGINYDIRRGQFRKIKSAIGRFNLETGALIEQENSFAIDLPKEVRGRGGRGSIENILQAESLAPLAVEPDNFRAGGAN